MEISVRELDLATAILEMNGEIDIYSSSDVKDAITNEIDSGIKNVVLDLEYVSYIDSSGIGAFISSLSAIKKVGGKICIINISDSVKKVFELTKLTNFFKMYASEEDAVAALQEI